MSERKTCKVCWVRHGKDLWEDACCCSNDVCLRKPEPTYSRPVGKKKETEYKVASYGDRWRVVKIDPTGSVDQVGPMHFHGLGPKSRPYPIELLENFKLFDSRSEADRVLSRLQDYLEDQKHKKKEKKKR